VIGYWKLPVGGGSLCAMQNTSDGAGFRRIAAVLMFLAVVLGAIAAHALEQRLEASGRQGTWQTAVLYHLIHGLALFVVAGLGAKVRGACWCFLLGILMFSGSLYAYALTEMKWLVAVTPFGGIAFLIGWLWLAVRKA